MLCSRCHTDLDIIYFSKSIRKVYYKVCDTCKAKTIYNKCLLLVKKSIKERKNCQMRLQPFLLSYGDLVIPNMWLSHRLNISFTDTMVSWNKFYNLIQANEQLRWQTIYASNIYYHYNQAMFNIANRKFLKEIKFSTIKRMINKLKLPDVLINVIFKFLC